MIYLLNLIYYNHEKIVNVIDTRDFQDKSWVPIIEDYMVLYSRMDTT